MLHEIKFLNIYEKNLKKYSFIFCFAFHSFVSVGRPPKPFGRHNNVLMDSNVFLFQHWRQIIAQYSSAPKGAILLIILFCFRDEPQNMFKCSIHAFSIIPRHHSNEISLLLQSTIWRYRFMKLPSRLMTEVIWCHYAYRGVIFRSSHSRFVGRHEYSSELQSLSTPEKFVGFWI